MKEIEALIRELRRNSEITMLVMVLDKAPKCSCGFPAMFSRVSGHTEEKHAEGKFWLGWYDTAEWGDNTCDDCLAGHKKPGLTWIVTHEIELPSAKMARRFRALMRGE